MSYRLSGINPLAYIGVEPITPPALLVQPRSPNSTDSKGYNLGTLWLVAAPPPTTNWELWILVDLTAGVATWIQLFPGSTGGVIRLDADIGFAIPTLGVINVLGGENINTFGDGSNNLFINLNESIRLPNTSSDGSQGVLFLGATGGVGGQTFLHNYGTGNTFTGTLAGNLTLNVGSAQDNSGYGNGVLNDLTDGAFNTAAGSLSQRFVTTGNLNSSLGATSLLNLVSGSNNLALGEAAGENYTGAESSNIMIANPGVLGESNTIRIGVDGVGLGQQDAAYMAGVYGRSVGGTNQTVIIDNTGKLGSSSSVATNIIITTFDASGTWTKNANSKMVEFYIWSGGHGGGSGYQGLTTASAGGGGGGAGGATHYKMPASFCGASESITVGAGGTGGAGQAAPNSVGNPGTNGGSSAIGSIDQYNSRYRTLGFNIDSFGGGGTTARGLGGAFGVLYDEFGIPSAGIQGGDGNPIAGGQPFDVGKYPPPATVNYAPITLNYLNPGAGGGGGGADSGTFRAGGRSSAFYSPNGTLLQAGTAGGAADTDGGNGLTPPTTGCLFIGGGGGSGGGGMNSVRAGIGGNGAVPGGGGGGGGGSLNGTISGAGGNGAAGRVIVVEYL